MPLYEYECKHCKRHTEHIQKFSDPEITECPHCGGTLERVISAPAIAFKGGGWFADGYGNAKPSSTNESKGDSGPGAAPSAEAASSSKEAPAPASSGSESSSSPAAAPSSTSNPEKK